MFTMLKKNIKSFLPLSVISCLKELQAYFKMQSTKKKIKIVLKEKKPIKLEIGSGKKKGVNGWLTLDMVEGSDIYWDLSLGLPFPDESIEKIYSSHVFEHFSYEDGQLLLEECHRVLVPDGEFSISVPNAKIYIEAYMNSDSLDENKYFGYKPAFNNSSKIDYVNYMAYMGGHHRHMFDEENLLSYLNKKEFKEVFVREFEPEFDLLVRDFESIYARAIK